MSVSRRGSTSSRWLWPGTISFDRYLRLRRPVTILVSLLALLVLAGLILADRKGWLFKTGDMGRYDHQSFLVAHVVDGDTLDVAAGDGDKPTTRVRFWGVDAPEMDHPGSPQPREPFALEAANLTRSLAEGNHVILILESHRIRDRYGRLLAYIELPDGRVLNEELLSAGLAHADSRWPHSQVDRYARIEEQAKHDKRGLWGARKRSSERP